MIQDVTENLFDLDSDTQIITNAFFAELMPQPGGNIVRYRNNHIRLGCVKQDNIDYNRLVNHLSQLDYVSIALRFNGTSKITLQFMDILAEELQHFYSEADNPGLFYGVKERYVVFPYTLPIENCPFIGEVASLFASQGSVINIAEAIQHSPSTSSSTSSSTPVPTPVPTSVPTSTSNPSSTSIFFSPMLVSSSSSPNVVELSDAIQVSTTPQQSAPATGNTMTDDIKGKVDNKRKLEEPKNVTSGSNLSSMSTGQDAPLHTKAGNADVKGDQDDGDDEDDGGDGNDTRNPNNDETTSTLSDANGRAPPAKRVVKERKPISLDVTSVPENQREMLSMVVELYNEEEIEANEYFETDRRLVACLAELKK